MTFPVPGLTTAELVRLFEATHQIAAERDEARAELAEQRKLSASLSLDNRALKDRLRDHEGLRAVQGQHVADLQQRLATQPTQPLAERPHVGPPSLCNCGMCHSHKQAVAMNTVRRLERDTG